MNFTLTPSTITVGQSVAFHVHVTQVDANGNPTGNVPTGMVDFSAGPTASSGQEHFWSQQLDGTGTIDFSYNGFVPGTYIVIASYPGDPSDKGIYGQLPLTVLPGPAAITTATTISPSPSSITAGSSTTLTASVVEPGGGTPPAGGEVDFFAGPTSTSVQFEGSGTLDASGHAQLTVGNFTAGSYVVRAQYLGDTANNVAGSFGDSTLLVSTSGGAAIVLPTQLVYTGPTEATFGTTVSLSAKLTQNGLNLGGEPLTLSLGSQSCTTPTTDGSGTASCSITINQPSGTYPVSAQFAGDMNWGPSAASASFVVDPAATTTSLVYNGSTSAVAGSVTTLAATLTDAHGQPIAGKAIHLTLGSQSCDGTTDATGKASCTITLNQPTGTYTTTATFAGDSSYSSSTASGTFTVTGIATTTTYKGDTTGKHGATASLVATVSGAPKGEQVTFTLGSQTCTGTLNAGKASCTVPLSDPAGSYTVTASYAGDGTYGASSDSATFTITSGQAVAAIGSVAPVLQGSSVTLTGTLTDGANGLSGKTLTLSLGSKSCTATTNGSGAASCAVTESDPSGTVTTKASFSGDGTYPAASATGSAIVYANAPGGGSFVIGDKSTSGTVTFWGSQWSRLNSLSGSSAPSSFKGFALNPSAPMCSAIWSTDPGNSASPPAGPLPAYMAVIVTSAAAKSGSMIYGNTVSVVIVKTNAGYANDPGHAGTGTVVATLCSGGSTTLPKPAANLTYTGPTTGQSGSQTTLTATLTSASGAPLANETVTLTLGTQSCTDTTDSNGVASCSITINQAAGSYTAGASFAGDSQNGADSDSASYTITSVQHGGKGSSCKGSFNGSNVGSGNTLWFNSSLHVSGLPWNGATITFTGQTITVGGQTFSVPDSKVIFSRSVTTATTTFTNGQWVTTVPVAYANGNVFLSGLGWQLPSGISGGQNVTWTGTFTSDTAGVNISWQWGAAAYNGFGSNGNLNVKPVDNSGWGWGDNNNAGTPENWSSHVTGGGSSGWGGSNYTGSYSNPCSLNF
jgi:large repetitive protein